MERALALLSKGVIDINQRGPLGLTPLMCAARCGYSRIVRVLLNKGATMSPVDNHGFSALHMAAQEGHLAVTKMLVKAAADLDAKITTAGRTPLHLAAQEGHSEVVGVLIEAGTNPNNRTLDGGTPLYFAPTC